MTLLADAVWTDILAYVRARYPDLARGWFTQLCPAALANGFISIRAADQSQLDYLSTNCLRPFVEAAQAATGRLISVEFTMATDAAPTRSAESQCPDAHWAAPSEAGDIRLNPDYVFANFVVGPCNRLAHATSVAVADGPGTTYNPLFIHGASGLGKTHLLQAVCHRLLDAAPASRVVFMSCEAFVTAFVDAVEHGALHGFRYRYRHADLLVIDDVQFLAGHEQTQEEFFHTFNALYQLNRQIILSADAPPADIPSLEDRLVSRFNWGVVARVDPPALETRMAIVRKKMRLRGLDLSEDVVLLVASRVTSNTRALEGAIAALHSLSACEGRKEISLDIAQQALGIPNPRDAQTIRIQDIMSVVTDSFSVKLSDLQGRRRSRSVALPRQVCMYLAREFTNHSLGEIGGFFGGRDHTTVLHAHKLIGQKRCTDPSFSSKIAEIEQLLRQN